MEMVTVINRTSKPLEVLWDGKVRPIPVGKSSHSAVVAQKAKEQNVLMGSQDPRTGDIVYLVAVEEWNEDDSPVEANPNPKERWNRKLLPGGEAAVREEVGRTGLFSGRDVQSKLSPDTSFTPNSDSGKIPSADPL